MDYVHPWGKRIGYEDAFSKIDMRRTHFEGVGLGADSVGRCIRWALVAKLVMAQGPASLHGRIPSRAGVSISSPAPCGYRRREHFAAAQQTK